VRAFFCMIHEMTVDLRLLRGNKNELDTDKCHWCRCSGRSIVQCIHPPFGWGGLSFHPWFRPTHLLLLSQLVFFMTPGLGVFYMGLTRMKNSLSLVMLCFLSVAVVTVQWFLFGFSLAFSETGSQFLGDTTNVVFRSVNNSPFAGAAPNISGLVFAVYELMFAVVTVAIIFGSVAERIRLVPCTIFIFCWTTLVYDVCAYWQWSARGWLRNLSCLAANTPCGIGSYDFAGGGLVQ
jgi:Amt family ammonium transporter